MDFSSARCWYILSTSNGFESVRNMSSGYLKPLKCHTEPEDDNVQTGSSSSKAFKFQIASQAARAQECLKLGSSFWKWQAEIVVTTCLPSPSWERYWKVRVHENLSLCAVRCIAAQQFRNYGSKIESTNYSLRRSNAVFSFLHKRDSSTPPASKSAMPLRAACKRSEGTFCKAS